MKISLVIDKIQEILNKNHTVKEKRSLRVMKGRINFACPICGDSSTNMNAKRGNLYLANFNYVCYNSGCRVHKTTFTRFLQFFNESVDLSLIEEIYELENKKEEIDFSFVQQKSKILFSLEDFRKMTGFVEYGNFPRIDNYLKKRKLDSFKDKIKIDIKRDGLWILNSINGQLLGAQFRNFSTFKPKYVSFPWSHLAKLLNVEVDVNEETLEILDRESLIYNLFYINDFEKVNILEGPIDSFFLDNSIAITGLHKTSILTDMFDKDSYRFILDNDSDADKIAERLVKSGEEVFSWNKFLTSELKQNRENKIQNNDFKFKDINDVFIFNEKMGQSILNDKYFVSSLIDWTINKKFKNE